MKAFHFKIILKVMNLKIISNKLMMMKTKNKVNKLLTPKNTYNAYKMNNIMKLTI